jgi:hypothetical protein
MKSIIAIIAASVIGLSVSGCMFSLGAVSNVSANVAAATPTACNDLATAGALTVAVAQQIIAANPNNAKIDAAAQKVIAGAALTASDCQTISTVIQIGNAAIQGTVAATSN